MSLGIKGFKPAKYEPPQNRDFEPIPAGEYPILITASEIKETSKKKSGEAEKGEYVEIVCEIQGEEHNGRLLWCRFNIHNDNETAEEIGRAELGALGRALGIEEVESEADFLGGEAIAKVKVKSRVWQGEKKVENEVCGWKPLNSGSASVKDDEIF